MKYYIIKPVSHKVNLGLKDNLELTFKDAIETKNLYEADIAVTQKGWTRSKNAVAEYHLAREHKIPCHEDYMFHKFKVHLN